MRSDSPIWFPFRGRELQVRKEGDRAVLPSDAEWRDLALEPLAVHRIGVVDGREAMAAELPDGQDAPAGYLFEGLRRLWGGLDEARWRAAGRAVQIVAWDRDHRFCGRCGGATERTGRDLERSCPRCQLPYYPRIAPAVIVQVRDGDRILLARSVHTPSGMYSTLAGFVEPGETLEETVAREIREEVGLEVTNIRYFGSQPWPFPNSLMIGFLADYAGGEIVRQEEEIEDAGWYRADALPPIPPPLSIARALIDDFISSSGPASRPASPRASQPA
jgi:NAD+ diphosphatase